MVAAYVGARLGSSTNLSADKRGVSILTSPRTAHKVMQKPISMSLNVARIG
jgi:hypothetical protein